MRSHYRNTNSIAYLLLCLFITSATAQSFIRQFTEDLNTNQQQEVGAGPIQDLDVAHHYLHKTQEISSRDYKVSGLKTVTGLRNRPPSSYSLKIDSYRTLVNSSYTEKYESRPFTVGRYNWTLIVYPKGNKDDGGSGYLSLYVVLDRSGLPEHYIDVYTDLTFSIFNKKEGKYFTIQDTDFWSFTSLESMRGYSQVLSVDTFEDPINGYLYDGENCEFGVDVTIPSSYDMWETLYVTENIPNPIFNWTIRGFSTMLKHTYFSDVFSIGERNWNIQVNPNGRGTGEGNALSMYLNLNSKEKEKFRPYEKIYVRAKLRVLNQRQHNNIERPIEDWLNGPGYGAAFGRGYDKFISISKLKDSSKGFVVDDVLILQVEIEVISSTMYSQHEYIS